MVDDQCLYRASSALELETKTIHNFDHRGQNVVVFSIIGRQIEVVRARDPCLIEDRKLQLLAEALSKVIECRVGAGRFSIGDTALLRPHHGPWIRRGILW